MTEYRDWADVLRPHSEVLRLVIQAVERDRAKNTVYPPKDLVFHALELTPFEDVKVVIIGMDPYSVPGQAMGLSFSIPLGHPLQPGARNVLREYMSDLGYPNPDHFWLVPWAERGVLLLNRILTVRQGEAGSHRHLGWQSITSAIVSALNQREGEPIAWILWGKDAWEVESLIDPTKHLIYTTMHPSPYTAHQGFFGSRPFSVVNDWRKTIHGLPPIDWRLPSLEELSERR